MFETVKQINAGVLEVGYVEAGPSNGQPVVLLHGWPYDIHSYVDVAPALGAAGYRVIVPYLRGFGTTRFRSSATPRNGQQSVVAVDVIALMDALAIESAIVGGFDWGARTANVVAALWPDRCKAMVSVSGYLIGSQEINKTPLPPKAELAWWYQYYFATERGRAGYDRYRPRFCQAHLADRLAGVELRRCNLRPQRRRVRQCRPCRHRRAQLPLADRSRGRGTAIRRPRNAVGREPGHRGADHHARRRRQRCPASRTERLRVEVLRQVHAPDHPGRCRAQPAARSAPGVRRRGHGSRPLRLVGRRDPRRARRTDAFRQPSRVAQHRALDGSRPARTRRARRLLDLLLHQLAPNPPYVTRRGPRSTKTRDS